MHDRQLLIDTDIFILLSGSGLFERVAAIFNLNRASLRRLPAVSRQLQKGNKFKKNYPDIIRKLGIEAASTIHPIETQISDASIANLLAAVDDIDPGEALLLGLLVENKSWLLTTGDKRFLRALARSPSLYSVRNAVAGRIVCLETVIELLVGIEGIKPVAVAFTNVRDCNQTLSVIFSSGENTGEEHCRAGLESKIRDLESDIGPNLLYRPVKRCEVDCI
ncbi:MAG: hypothetical protein JWL59_1388 [Chthoniobacteraceae bacterium]|nr:hypothetical protein [Chthoniobacteraceae bacterium]